MTRSKLIVIPLAALWMGLTLAACGGGNEAGPSPEAADVAELEVAVMLNWNQFTPVHTPMFVADERGYFDDEGVKVSYEISDGSQTVVSTIGAGKHTLGYASLNVAAQGISKGLPVVAIASLQPQGDLALVTKADSGIEGPEDIVGKRIGSTPTGSDSALLPAFLDANGIASDEVEVVHMPGDAKMTALIAGRVDAISGQGYFYAALLEEKDIESNQVLFASHGANVIGDGFIVNRNKADDNAEGIRRFLAAYERGFQDTFANVDEACQIFLDTGVTGYTVESCKSQLVGWQELFSHPSVAGKPFGWNSDEVWRDTLDILTATKMIEDPAPVSDYYTNAYLEPAEGE